jgi:hypothetical protein
MSKRSAFASHPVVIAGVLLTTMSAVLFIAAIAAELLGLIRNPYGGLIVYVVIPHSSYWGCCSSLWAIGSTRGDGGATPQSSTTGRCSISGIPGTRRVALTITVLTVANLAIISVAAFGGMRAMESPSFCGRRVICRCIRSSRRGSPHRMRRLPAPMSHRRRGGALVHYKLAGVRQLYHVVTNQIPKPIPAVADMRPALETCGRCHWPGTIR